MSRPKPLFWRALAAFLALPGTVAFLVPWLFAQDGGRVPPVHFVGALPFGAGFMLLLWCVREFYVSGTGTLAPWSPPKSLVATGPYRYSRNPMYVAVTLILIGWALGFRTRPLWVYVLIVVVAFHLRVVFGEEPWLTRTHGQAWQAYRRRVRRWL